MPFLEKAVLAIGMIYGLTGYNSPLAVLRMLRRPRAFFRAIKISWRAAQDEQLIDRLRATSDVDGLAQVAFDKHGGPKDASAHGPHR